MAKNLQTVLNSVVNDLLQESDDLPETSDYMKSLLDPASPNFNPQRHEQIMKSAGEVYSNLLRQQNMDAAQAGTRATIIDPRSYVASSKYVQDQINDIEGSPINRAKSGWEDAKDWMSQNPLATAGIGTGLGAALAAGAGALYLRKKQREANRAAGR